MITIYDGNERTRGTGRMLAEALRWLVKHELDFAWKPLSVELESGRISMAIQTDDCRHVHRTSYSGPAEEMRLLIGVAVWYEDRKDDPTERSRMTIEILQALNTDRGDRGEMLRQLRERFEPFANRLL